MLFGWPRPGGNVPVDGATNREAIPSSPAMPHQVAVGAAGVLQGIGQNGHVMESTLIVNPAGDGWYCPVVPGQDGAGESHLAVQHWSEYAAQEARLDSGLRCNGFVDDVPHAGDVEP